MTRNDHDAGVEPPPPAWDIEVAAAIIGGGACGLTAAITCARAGAETVVFERDARPMGSTAMSYGSIRAAGTAVQARTGVEDTVEALAEDIIAAARGKTDPDHARLLAVNSRLAVDWLTEDLGFDLTLETNWNGFGHRAPRLHGTPNRDGEELMAMLLSAASEAGATLATQARATTLYKSDDGTIAGFSYRSPEGVIRVGCKALILSTGGYSANKEIIANHIPAMKNAVYYGAEWHMGEALSWGEELGAACADLGAYQALGNLAIPHNIVIPHTLVIDGGFSVNTDGARFHNELENISGQALTILEQPGGVCWMIYDKAGHEKTSGLFGEYHEGNAVNAYKSADTIESLAETIGAPPRALRNTFEAVTSYAETGETDMFGRRFQKETELKPPYYAVRITGALFHTQGGLCIDDKARVRLKNGGAVRNLFAGGGAARSVSGPAEWGYLPGIGLCTAVGFGRLAGLQAAQLVNQPAY